MRERGNKFIDPDKAFIIHKDQWAWLRNYKGKDTPIDALFREREEKLDEGEPFWNSDHDEEMKETARERNHLLKGGEGP